MTADFDHADEDLWIFGYGSLMWRPGFRFEERVPARLIGLHRALCVYSFVHRGTPEKPGLVLGLDRGGACRGIAYRVDKARRAETLAYLREREQVTHVYRETMRAVSLDCGRRDGGLLTAIGQAVPGATADARQVTALVYVVDRSHPQYAGRLDLAAQLHHVRQGHGRGGPNRDYVIATVKEIEAQGCFDAKLHRLAQMLRGPHETHAAE
ncbi:MAG: gamma-glutamylcyclotransferase [Xanthobacteraceae bacterium]